MTGAEDLFLEVRPRGNPYLLDVARAPLLKPDECHRLVSGADPDGWRNATVVFADGGAPVSVQPQIRSVAEQRAIVDDDGWPLSVVSAVVAKANIEYFRFDLHGLLDEDTPRLLRYESDSNDHYTLHVDLTPIHTTRKLSFVVQLSDPGLYDGGDVEFAAGGDRANRTQGTITIFPSYKPHRVAPVTRGTRYALVGWVHGNAFR